MIKRGISASIIRQSYLAACSMFKSTEAQRLSRSAQKLMRPEIEPAAQLTKEPQRYFLSKEDIRKTEEILKEASCSHNPF